MNLFDRNRHDDIDEIDAALNALMSDMSYQPTSENLALILDTHRMAMSAVRSDPAAKGPAAGTWNRVLRATAQSSSKGFEEMTATTWDGSIPTSSLGSTERVKGRLPRFTTIAATLAVVSLLAFGGWFAATNLPPASEDLRLAVMQATPLVASTCDVESMTVDRVMAIVKNPYSAYDEDEITSSSQLSLWRDRSKMEFLEPLFAGVDLELMDRFTYPAREPGFDNAIDRANGFLACAQGGTVGQLLNFMDPREIQRVVLSNHPVFRDEAGVRATVEELVGLPASTFVFPGQTPIPYAGLTLSANPERASALVAMGSDATRYEATQLMMLGVVATNTEGTIVYQGNADGSANPNAGLTRQSQFRLILKQSSINGQWYVWATIPMTVYAS